MSDWTPQEVNQAIEKVTQKAMTDKDFREIALKDPSAAVEQLMGKPIPAEFTIKIIENAPGVDQTFVLPDLVSEELSDEELENVAGGGDCRGNASACGAQACGIQA